MSNAPEPANTTTTTEAPKKKGSKMMLIIIVLVLAVGGGGYFFFLRGSNAAAKAKTDKNKKAHAEEKADEGENSEAKGAEKEGEKDDKSAKISLPDDSDVKQVTELQPFIVNLADKDSARYLRLTLSLGIGESESDEKIDPIFVTRVRNALLAVLTSKTSEEVLSAEGKNALRKELLKAAQAASEAPKVEAIYITDCIVQL